MSEDGEEYPRCGAAYRHSRCVREQGHTERHILPDQIPPLDEAIDGWEWMVQRNGVVVSHAGEPVGYCDRCDEMTFGSSCGYCDHVASKD